MLNDARVNYRRTDFYIFSSSWCTVCLNLQAWHNEFMETKFYQLIAAFKMLSMNLFAIFVSLCSLTQTPTSNIWTRWQCCTLLKYTIHLLTTMCDCIGTGVDHWRYPSVSVSHYPATLRGGQTHSKMSMASLCSVFCADTRWR